MILNFFINKDSQGRKLSAKKIPTCSNSAYIIILSMIQTFFGQWNSQFQFSESDVWSNQNEKCYYPYLEAVIRHF